MVRWKCFCFCISCLVKFVATVNICCELFLIQTLTYILCRIAMCYGWTADESLAPMDDFLRSSLPADVIPAIMNRLPELNVTQPDKVEFSRAKILRLTATSLFLMLHQEGITWPVHAHHHQVSSLHRSMEAQLPAKLCFHDGAGVARSPVSAAQQSPQAYDLDQSSWPTAQQFWRLWVGKTSACLCEVVRGWQQGGSTDPWEDQVTLLSTTWNPCFLFCCCMQQIDVTVMNALHQYMNICSQVYVDMQWCLRGSKFGPKPCPDIAVMPAVDDCYKRWRCHVQWLLAGD